MEHPLPRGVWGGVYSWKLAGLPGPETRQVPVFQAGIVGIAKEELQLHDKSVVVNFAFTLGFKDIIGLEFKLVAHEIEVEARVVQRRSWELCKSSLGSKYSNLATAWSRGWRKYAVCT